MSDFQPILIIAGDFKSRRARAVALIKKIDPDLISGRHPDLISLDESDSIGIKEIRQLQKKIGLKPFRAKVKVAVIPQAEKLTVPAQNAFLKTLEEPPDSTQIILLSSRKEALLPTILSRCRLVTLQIAAGPAVAGETIQILALLLGNKVGERLKMAESYKTRPASREIVLSLLSLWRQILLQNSGVLKADRKTPFSSLDLPSISLALHRTEQARRFLESNANPSLVIDNLFLGYPRTD